MSDRLPFFEVFIKQRRRRWSWSVCTKEGTLVMTGSRISRSAASYDANRALFLLLLSAPYRSRPPPGDVDQEPRAHGPLPPKF